jgi:uncharacterized protein YjbJ (UPF0337 family)
MLAMRGTADKAWGRLKQAAGVATGDRTLQREGRIDRATGEVKDRADQARRRVDQMADDARDRLSRLAHRH